MPFLPGFEERWRDAPHFVISVTQEVWDERRLDRIGRFYAEDAVLRTPEGLLRGRAALLAEAQARLAAFPDMALLPEDMQWTQTGYKSFEASERHYVTATHVGPGLYGAPTGRALGFRVLTDSWCRGNEVAEVWRITDRAAIVAALGHDPEGWARASIAAEGGPENCVLPLSAETDMPPKHEAKLGENPWGATLADILVRIMAGEIAIIARGYDRAVELAYPGGRTLSGHAEAEAFWTGLRASFPTAKFTVQQSIGTEDKPESPRASVRWVLEGRHDGFGTFGAPTGAQVTVMGITQAVFGPRGLYREWTLVDPLAIWRQIMLATGSV
ncbi:ester cyclase [Sagittula sp. S175]|uniref:nuclear transport factor 2 family protein n=1 Tax=Sagittula sp. S175 TaxID=3415129 RepID=UPI003C7CBBF0